MTYKNKGSVGEVISEQHYFLLPLTERLYYKPSYDKVTHNIVLVGRIKKLVPLPDDDGPDDLKGVSISSPSIRQ